MGTIDFSTACLHKFDVPLIRKISFIHKSIADALEISVSFDDFLSMRISNELLQAVLHFKYISWHLPGSMRYGNNAQTRAMLDRASSFQDIFHVKAFVLHPWHVDDFHVLQSSRLPIIKENGDKTQFEFTDPDHIQMFSTCHNFGFCCDLPHAYEHDSTMALVRKLLGIMGNRLQEVHVSGQNATFHHTLLIKVDHWCPVKDFNKLLKCPPLKVSRHVH